MTGPREPSGAPSFPFVIGLALAVFITAVVVRFVLPPLEARTSCAMPKDAETRLIYLHREGNRITTECGPIVGSRGTYKSAR